MTHKKCDICKKNDARRTAGGKEICGHIHCYARAVRPVLIARRADTARIQSAVEDLDAMLNPKD